MEVLCLFYGTVFYDIFSLKGTGCLGYSQGSSDNSPLDSMKKMPGAHGIYFKMIISAQWKSFFKL